MEPIHEVLSRIRWHPAFAGAHFEIAYADHVAGGDVRVPLASIVLDVGVPGTIGVLGTDGVMRHIPLHRIRTVYRDGEPMWRRPGPAAARTDPDGV